MIEILETVTDKVNGLVKELFNDKGEFGVIVYDLKKGRSCTYNRVIHSSYKLAKKGFNDLIKN